MEDQTELVEVLVCAFKSTKPWQDFPNYSGSKFEDDVLNVEPIASVA